MSKIELKQDFGRPIEINPDQILSFYENCDGGPLCVNLKHHDRSTISTTSSLKDIVNAIIADNSEKDLTQLKIVFDQVRDGQRHGRAKFTTVAEWANENRQEPTLPTP